METLLPIVLGLCVWLLLPAGRDAAAPVTVRDHASSAEDSSDGGAFPDGGDLAGDRDGRPRA